MFQGIFTAIITPFKNGRVDEESYRDLIERQIEEGINGIVPCGTTGEAVTLRDEEFERVVKVCVEQVNKRIPVIAGAGSNSTEKAIKQTKIVARCGVDGILQVTPYYNKPTQEGLYQHFTAIAKTTELPIILYNVPGRTSVNMLPETVLRLSKTNNIIALKEASGNLDQIKAIIGLVDEHFSVLSGDDALNLDIYNLGGKGAISVTSNVVPSKVVSVWNEFEIGNADKAKELHEGLAALTKVLFIETNPIPTKTSLAMMGLCKEEFRLPLVSMSNEHRLELEKILKQYELI